jgi:hypothetical protein
MKAENFGHNCALIEDVIMNKRNLRPFFYYGNRKLRVKKYAIMKALQMAHKSMRPVKILLKNEVMVIERRVDYRALVVQSLENYKKAVG